MSFTTYAYTANNTCKHLHVSTHYSFSFLTALKCDKQFPLFAHTCKTKEKPKRKKCSADKIELYAASIVALRFSSSLDNISLMF